MAFEKYGGYVWQSEPTQPEHTLLERGFGLGVAVGAAGAAYAAAAPFTGGRPLDALYHSTRFIGNLSPFSILNTFRAPEWMSPFVSGHAQGLKDGTVYSWDKSFLGSNETFHYIKQLTRLDDAQLRKAGLAAGMVGDGLADSLEFVRGTGHRGSLYTVVGGKRHLLSDAVALMQATSEEPILLAKEKSLNRAAHGVLQAQGVTEEPWFRAEKLFARDGAPDVAGGAAKFIPIPSVSGPLRDATDLKQRTAYLRGFPAFGMERLNTLLEGVTSQFPFLGDINRGLDKVLGTSLTVTSGPASTMFARYGLLGAKVGGAVMGLQTLDWARRNYGDAGHIAASGVVSVGLAHVLTKLGKSPQTAVMAGVASFFGQLALPGFEQGTIQGLATTWAKASVMRAELSPFNWYRRTVEGLAPGISDWQIGALAGVVGVGLASLPLPFVGKRLPDILLERYGNEAFGLEKHVKIGDDLVKVAGPKTVRQEFWRRVEDAAKANLSQNDFEAWKRSKGPLSMRRAQLTSMLKNSASFSGSHGAIARMNQMWGEAEEAVKLQHKNNPVNYSLAKKLDGIRNKYLGNETFTGKVSRFAEGAKATLIHSFFGADPLEDGFLKSAREMGFSPKLGRTGVLFAGAFLAHGLLTGGLLGSMETANDLRDIYAGRKMVEVRKSRFWEGGGTPYEGDTIAYHRPHWYHLLMNRVREKGLWGEAEDTMSPVGKWLRKNFTYQWEEEHYYDRPYPVSGAAFQDVPVIGKYLAATVGKLIKPARLMHASEWIREGEGGFETADVYQGFRREPAYNLGATGSGIPTTQLAGLRILGETSYQFRELEGMTGWAKNVISNITTGGDTYFGQRAVLQSASGATSATRSFWEMQMGGGAFMNEAIRRFLPTPFGEGEKINPIMNSMPSWLPEKFRYGDPYANIEWGEARLPGAGFAALHPELAGVDPEAYPLIYKYQVLADVAPYSEEFRRVRKGMYDARARGETNEAINQRMDYIDSLVSKKMDQYSFDRLHQNAIELPGSRLTQEMWAGAQTLIRDIAAPAEYLTPMGFRPFQKLMGDRTPLEQYEYERLYGTKVAFWDKPWRDWFRPSMYSAAHMMGFEGKPLWRQEADSTNQYFDQLDFIKWMRLAQQADQEGNHRAKIQYLYMASSTRTGVNPQGNPLSIYWSLPAEERPFFNAFATAPASERERILEMVPEDQAQLYRNIWQRLDQGGDPALFPGSPTMPNEQYLSQRFYELQGQFTGPLPAEDWIGWHQDVDMSDIKVMYVDQMGKDLHDYGLWERQLRETQNQPYLEGAAAPLMGQSLGRGELASQMYGVMRGSFQGPHVAVHGGPGAGYGKLVYNDNREAELMTMVRSALEF